MFIKNGKISLFIETIKKIETVIICQRGVLWVIFRKRYQDGAIIYLVFGNAKK
jgi:hypothetical protein